MADKLKRNLKVVGEATVTGGDYKNVSVVGQAVVSGDLDCIDLNVCGTCDINGSLKAKKGKLIGEVSIEGTMTCDGLEVIGNTDINGNAVIKELKIKGSADVKDGISSEIINQYGEMKVKGDCNAEIFDSKGPFNIEGLLNAGRVDIELHRKCQVKEIGGGKINIKRGTDFILKKIFKSFYVPSDFYEGQLFTDSIEGDDIYIEYTKAKVVRGNNIRIGKGCDIELVEYKNNFEISNNSIVKENIKI